MRTDDDGNPCPATLGEYRDFCAALREDCEAVRFLDKKIAEHKNGRDELVLAPDSQMRSILFPMIFGDGD